ncbi:MULTISPECIES: hypothetical protein [unclassified Pseudomonas]|uniref:hypothetical protein n=1 Tax=unclassified Pseudomonas TaxID=196821 RepID=UPI0025E57219|nr:MULTISPECIES: hypothetical protein [unclassified Pseudomonas]
MALARSRRLGIADLLRLKEVDLKKAAIFPQALLRGNDRSRLSVFFTRYRRFFVQHAEPKPENGKIAAPAGCHLSQYQNFLILILRQP